MYIHISRTVRKRMSMTVLHNASSMAGHMMTQRTSPALKKSLEKLSLGLRTQKSSAEITQSLSESDALKAGTFRVLAGIQDGISMIQAASQSLGKIQDMAGRIRELALQAGNDELALQDRGYMQAEINAARNEITHVADNARFGRKRLLNGDSAVLWSSSDSRVKAVIRGGLRSSEMSGQKFSVDGDYTVSAHVDAGQAQIQESNTFTVNGAKADGDTTLGNTDQLKGILPKELTLTQGDGRQAAIILREDDTLHDMAAKFSRAISHGLGQGEYTNDTDKFATFTEEGTLVLRSALAGKNGSVTVSTGGELMRALSLKTTQTPQETHYTATITESGGAILAENVKAEDGVIHGAIHSNIDIDLGAMFGVNASWNDDAGKFELEARNPAQATIHTADNTAVFQTGEGGAVMVSAGDMRADALGLGSVNVMSRESAFEAVAAADRASDIVAVQQAKLGALQSRLERHIRNLTGKSESLIEIQNAEEIMSLAKNSILTHSNSAMLSQANQSGQNVLLLFRG